MEVDGMTLLEDEEFLYKQVVVHVTMLVPGRVNRASNLRLIESAKSM